MKKVNFKIDYLKKNYYYNISILGFLLCALWVMIIDTKPFSDFQYYNQLAKQIANGGAFGDTYTSVGYSIILGFVYKIWGYNLLVGKWFNIFLTCLNYLIVYKILKRMNMNEKKRKIMYLLFVLFPNNIFYNSIIATEILFTTILLLITLVYYSDIKYKYIIIGFFTASASMIKPFFIIFFIVIFIVELALKNRLFAVIKHSITILAISMVCLSPWIYRNTKLIGEFTFISNNSGIVLYINNNSQNVYGRWMTAENVENSLVTKKYYINANATERNKMLSSAAKKWIITHPKQFFILGFKRLINTYLIGGDLSYSLNGTTLSSNLKVILNIYANDIKSLIFLLAIVSAIIYTIKAFRILIRRENTNLYTMYNLTLFYMFSCVYFITEGQPRYSFPIIFIAIYFFTCLLENLLLCIKNKKS